MKETKTSNSRKLNLEILEKVLKKHKFKFENKNTFDNGNHSCYFFKKENGYLVFFIFGINVIDFAIYDSNKKLISMIADYTRIVKAESIEDFISELIIID